MSILQPIYNELIVRMYSVLFLFENPVIVHYTGFVFD